MFGFIGYFCSVSSYSPLEYSLDLGIVQLWTLIKCPIITSTFIVALSFKINNIINIFLENKILIFKSSLHTFLICMCLIKNPSVEQSINLSAALMLKHKSILEFLFSIKRQELQHNSYPDQVRRSASCTRIPHTTTSSHSLISAAAGPSFCSSRIYLSLFFGHCGLRWSLQRKRTMD